MNERCEAPLFIVGTERSGSNLMRLILDAHSRIDVPHPPHLMNYLGPIESSYGDLSEPRSLRSLARDLLWIVRRHIYPWDVQPTVDELISDAASPDLLGLMGALYDAHRRYRGKARWGCKSTFVIDYVDRVLEQYPAAQFVWLVRDPRDVAVSSRKSVFSPCHPVNTARLWTRQQAHGLELEKRLSSERWHRMTYEQLTTDPEGEIRRVCEFLGEEFEPGMLRFFETD
ncbi:MAG: sulfotransferase, partial [Myxococcota bacterium]|nr:sulfotransferase [Myxococcota bacterium]